MIRFEIQRYVNGKEIGAEDFFAAKYKNERAAALLRRVMRRENPQAARPAEDVPLRDTLDIEV